MELSTVNIMGKRPQIGILKILAGSYDDFWLVRIFSVGPGWPEIVSALIVESWKFEFMNIESLSFDAWFLVLMLWAYDQVRVRFIYLFAYLDGVMRVSSKFQIGFELFWKVLNLLVLLLSQLLQQVRECEVCICECWLAFAKFWERLGFIAIAMHCPQMWSSHFRMLTRICKGAKPRGDSQLQSLGRICDVHSCEVQVIIATSAPTLIWNCKLSCCIVRNCNICSWVEGNDFET